MEEDAVMDYFVKARVNQATGYLKNGAGDYILLPYRLSKHLSKDVVPESIVVSIADYVVAQQRVNLLEQKNGKTFFWIKTDDVAEFLTSCSESLTPGFVPRKMIEISEHLPLTTHALYDYILSVFVEKMGLDIGLWGFFTGEEKIGDVQHYLKAAKKYGYLLTLYPSTTFYDVYSRNRDGQGRQFSKATSLKFSQLLIESWRVFGKRRCNNVSTIPSIKDIEEIYRLPSAGKKVSREKIA